MKKKKENKMKLRCSICKKVVAEVEIKKLIIPFEVGCIKCLDRVEKRLDEIKTALHEVGREVQN